MSKKLRPCVACGQTIAKTAPACPRCGAPNAVARKSSACGLCGVLLFAPIVIVAIMAVFTGEMEKAHLTPEQLAARETANADAAEQRNRESFAIANSQIEVRKHLKAPSTAEWVGVPKAGELQPNRWIVFGEVDSQNSFGAMIRTDFYVAYELSDDGSTYSIPWYAIEGKESGMRPDWMLEWFAKRMMPDQEPANASKMRDSPSTDMTQAEKKAERYRELAREGYAFAQFLLGAMYHGGEGIPQDYKEAVKWYRKAAEQGHADAQHQLGFMHDKGEGIPRDYIEAHKWFSLAAAEGDEVATKSRDLIAKKMTPEQITEAQKLAREWKPKKPQGK